MVGYFKALFPFFVGIIMMEGCVQVSLRFFTWSRSCLQVYVIQMISFLACVESLL